MVLVVQLLLSGITLVLLTWILLHYLLKYLVVDPTMVQYIVPLLLLFLKAIIERVTTGNPTVTLKHFCWQEYLSLLYFIQSEWNNIHRVPGST